MKNNNSKSKDTYYFSHDSNAFTDPKILSMRYDYGLQGYGLYWVIIEMLRNEATYKLSLDKTTYRAIQMQTYTDIDIEKYIDDCINEYRESSQGNGLFNSDGTYFWSESLLNRMSKMERVREKRAEAGKKSAEKRWGKKAKKKRIIKCPKFDKNNKNITSVKKFITNVKKNNNNVIRILRKDVTKYNKIKENKRKENKINNIYIHYNTLHYNNLFINITENENFEDGLSFDEREIFRRLLHRLELDVKVEHFKYLTDEKILEYKVMYWALKELMTSAYKIYEYDLDRKTFLLKFLLTKHYKILEDNEESIKDFISYFIKCLQNELKKGDKNNAKGM